ncbi:DUF218 domain-containing protein [Facklamia miroungae]|uniref:DUF218 domain-containing protein n=2 Tax=Facklamia miroungae TaxID=120956 RepID=A0A1G7RXD3_9LACT|nr:DUF218 domain-containing protein [Facklamia miroungae]
MHLLVIFFLSIFILMSIYERRTLLYSLSLILLVTTLCIDIILIYERNGIDIFQSKVGYLLIILAILFILLTIIGPVMITFTFIFEGIRLLLKEGIYFRNLLAVGVGFLFIFSPFITTGIIELANHNTLIIAICNIYRIIITYLLVVASAYTLSSFLNFINTKKHDLDYVVVLGAGLIGEQVTPLLKSRIDKGIKVFKKQKNCRLIMSGGQGSDELISEAEAMKRYAVDVGIDPQLIIEENKSTNTKENIKNSYSLMAIDDPKFAIVTNYYHLFRALLLSKKLNIKCIGYGAKTRLYFSLNAFVREFIGYLAMSYKVHSITLLFLIVPYLIFLWIDTLI